MTSSERNSQVPVEKCDCGAGGSSNHAPWCLTQPPSIRQPELERRESLRTSKTVTELQAMLEREGWIPTADLVALIDTAEERGEQIERLTRERDQARVALRLIVANEPTIGYSPALFTDGKIHQHKGDAAIARAALSGEHPAPETSEPLAYLVTDTEGLKHAYLTRDEAEHAVEVIEKYRHHKATFIPLYGGSQLTSEVPLSTFLTSEEIGALIRFHEEEASNPAYLANTQAVHRLRADSLAKRARSPLKAKGEQE